MAIATYPNSALNPIRTIHGAFLIAATKPVTDANTRATIKVTDADSAADVEYNGNVAYMVAYPVEVAGSPALNYFYFEPWPIVEARFAQLLYPSGGTGVPVSFWTVFDDVKITAPDSCIREFDVTVEYFIQTDMGGYTIEESDGTETQTGIVVLPAYQDTLDTTLTTLFNTTSGTKWMTMRPLERNLALTDSDGMAFWRIDSDLNAFRIIAYAGNTTVWMETVDITSDVVAGKVAVITTGPLQIRSGFSGSYALFASSGSPTMTNITHYTMSFGKYSGGVYTQYSELMRVNIVDRCAEVLPFHFINRFGQVDSMHFDTFERIVTNTVQRYRREYPVDAVNRIQYTSLGQFGGKGYAQYRVQANFVSTDEFEYLQDLFTSADVRVQLEDQNGAKFVPCTIEVDEYRTNTSANNQNGTVTFVATISHEYSNRG